MLTGRPQHSANSPAPIFLPNIFVGHEGGLDLRRLPGGSGLHVVVVGRGGAMMDQGAAAAAKGRWSPPAKR